jgi:lipid-binding SYLF domain-containing protein
MKKTVLGLMVLGVAASALALDKVELDNRVRFLTAKFEVLQQSPAKSIPAETLSKARGIVLLDRTKAGFVFAYQGGAGVAMVKDEKSGQWSPVTFLTANEASLGFQLGGQQSFVVILLMDTNAVHMLTEPKFQFGGEARGTAGDSSAGVEGEAVPQEPSVLVFDDRRGLYGGASIKGGSIAPDVKANIIYYGQALTTSELLFENKVKPTEAAVALAGRIAASSKLAKN